MGVGALVCFPDHPKKRALTQLCFDAVEFAADSLVLRVTPVVKCERFVASWAEIVVTPGVDYSGCTDLLIVVIPGFLPQDHKVFVLENLGLSILLIGRFIRTVRCDVAWLVTDVTCAGFQFSISSGRCSWFRIAHLFKRSLSQIRMPDILSVLGIC